MDLYTTNFLGTFHSRHESESEWLAVSSKWLESVKSHSTGLETMSSCWLDCENSSSTGLVYLNYTVLVYTLVYIGMLYVRMLR